MAIAILEDIHNLGQKIVWSVLGAGGNGVMCCERQEAAPIVTKAKEDGVEVLMVSTPMYRSALRVKELRKEVASNFIAPVLAVGGAPFIFDQELW